MIHKTLEKHLEEHCPMCGETHKSEWEHQKNYHQSYKILTCNTCEYKLFLKIDFMTDGTFL